MDFSCSVSGGGSLNFCVPFNSASSVGENLRHVELEKSRVIFHRTTDINRRGKHAEIPFFQRTDVVGADFRRIRNLLHRQFFGLAPCAKLFCNRWHFIIFSAIDSADWQSWKSNRIRNCILLSVWKTWQKFLAGLNLCSPRAFHSLKMLEVAAPEQLPVPQARAGESGGLGRALPAIPIAALCLCF